MRSPGLTARGRLMNPSLPPALSLPSLFQTIRFVKKPIPLLQECKKQLGEVFTIPLAGIGNMVFLTNPRDLKDLYTEDTQSLSASASNQIFFGPIMGPGSLLALDGVRHLRRRKLLMPFFHGQRVATYVRDMREITHRAMAGWQLGKPFALLPEGRELALRIIFRTILGLSVEHLGELGELLKLFAEKVVNSPLMSMPKLQKDFGPYSPWGRVLGIMKKTDAMLMAEIARRRAASDNGADILAQLLSAKDEDGRALTDSEIRDELLSLIVSGFEATAFGFSWAFERILSHPRVYEKIQAELTEVLGKGELDAAALPKLEYLDAAIREVLRNRPLAPIAGTRQVIGPAKVAGYALPRGTIVTNCAYLIMNRPELYPEPEVYRPERFLNSKDHPYDYPPVRGGTRRCVGMSLALTMIKVVVASAFTRARFGLDTPDAKAIRYGFFLVPEGGPRIRVLEWKKS